MSDQRSQGLRGARRRSGRSVVSASVSATGRAVIALAVVAVVASSCSLLQPETEVLLIGDSIMRQTGEFLEVAFEEDAGVDGADTQNEGRNGTGLLTPGTFDWHEELPGLLSRYDPEIVVVLFIGNYTDRHLYVNADGEAVEGYTPEFFEAWGVEADRLMEILAEADVETFWVQPPPLPDAEGQRRVGEMREVYTRLAERWPGTGLVDGTVALSDPDGTYATQLPVPPDGRVEPVRSVDTVHLTASGARLLAGTTAEVVGPTLLRVRED